ncbi:MAG TPA: hypothetical protein VFV50_07990, partial [Bdellovibrionales bacterium]|nr:hypothetical protein [Bdellovibrionales bacterium]
VVLMVREFGEYRAKLMADIHERNVISMASLMDRYNNAYAIWDARQRLAAGQPLTDDAVIARALELIRARQLVFLKPELPEHAGFHYSQHSHFVQWAHELLKQRLK